MAETVTHQYVIDACALIAYLRSEEGGDKLRELLKQPAVRFFMHAVNLGKVYYDSLRYVGLSKAKEMLDEVLQLPLTVVWELDRPFLERVGYYKTTY